MDSAVRLIRHGLRPVRAPSPFPNSGSTADAHEANLFDGPCVEVVGEVLVQRMPIKELESVGHFVGNGEPSALRSQVVTYEVL